MVFREALFYMTGELLRRGNLTERRGCMGREIPNFFIRLRRVLGFIPDCVRRLPTDRKSATPPIGERAECAAVLNHAT